MTTDVSDIREQVEAIARPLTLLCLAFLYVDRDDRGDVPMTRRGTPYREPSGLTQNQALQEENERLGKMLAELNDAQVVQEKALLAIRDSKDAVPPVDASECRAIARNALSPTQETDPEPKPPPRCPGCGLTEEEWIARMSEEERLDKASDEDDDG